MLKILLLSPITVHSLKIKHYLELKDMVIQTDYKITYFYLTYIKVDFIISYNYPYIISENIINNYGKRIINLHISLLPWNRGADPNFWSWFDNTPKGVTIHYIDKELDTGNILLRKEIDIWKENDTLYTTYEKLQRAVICLFIRNWDNVKKEKIEAKSQPKKMGSFHYRKDKDKYSFLLEKHEWNTPVKFIESYGRKING